MRYMAISPPSVLLDDFVSCHPSHQRPSLSDIQDLADKGRLYTTDDDIALLVRNPTPPLAKSAETNSVGSVACLLIDEPIRMYVPLRMRPWITQACYSTVLATLAPRALCACWGGFTGRSA